MTNNFQQTPNEKFSEPLKNKGPKINESKNEMSAFPENKTKVKIAPLNLLESCTSMYSFLEQIKLESAFKEILKEYEITIIDKLETEGTRSLLHIIDTPDALSIIIPKNENNSFILPDDIKSESYSALLLRLARIKLKLSLFYYMFALMNNAHILRNRYNALLKKINTTHLDLDFKKSKIAGIGVGTTIKLLKKHLSQFEFDLKSNLQAMHDLLNLNSITDIPYGIKGFSLLYNAMKNIAPKGFAGIEKDYYYVCRLLLEPTFEEKIFDEVQNKQWQSYKQEILALLTFCTILHPTQLITPDFNALTLSIAQPAVDRNTINVPVTIFFDRPCSKITFARFITVLNHFIPIMWIISYNHVYTVKTS